MKRSEMVCVNCIKFAGSDDATVAHQCRNSPQPRSFIKGGLGDLIDADPSTHWCGEGEWQEWNEDYGHVDFIWGEWEDKP